MKRFIGIGILFLFAFSQTIFAQQTDTARMSVRTDTLHMNMQQCVDYALDHQIAVRNALLDEQISQRNSQSQLAEGLPQINTSFNFQDYLHLPTTLIPAEFLGGEPGTFVPIQFGTQYNAIAAISGSQLIFDGRYFLGLKATRTLEDLSMKTTTQTKIQTMDSVEKAYLRALISSVRIQQIDNSLANIKRTFDDTKALYQSGMVEKLDVDRINVTYNNLLVQRDQTIKFVQLSMLDLKYMMGLDVNQPLVLTDSIREANFQDILQNAMVPNVENRIEYQSLQTSISLDEMNVKQYKVGYYPTLYLNGEWDYAAQRNEFDFFHGGTWYRTTYLGLKLNLPIFDGLKKAREIQSAKLSMQKDQNIKEEFTNSMNLQVAAAKAGLQNAISALGTQRSNLDLAQEVSDLSRKKYQQGVGSSLDVTDAESSLRDSQINYLNALYQAWVAAIDLEVALGTFYTGQ
jgi:outer membrane protein